jgi:hypothetical protein
MLGENRGVFRHGSAWLALEALALVAAAAAAALLHLSPVRIAVVMGGVFAIVSLLDLAVIRSRVRGRREVEPIRAPRPAPLRPSSDRLWVDGVRPTRPAALAPARKTRSRTAPPVSPVPPAPVERIVAAGREPLPAAAGNGTGWNVWDLQSRARALAGRNPLQDEEWAFLLLYLREFASPDGILPGDFDRLVRTSFAQLVGRR